MAGTEEAIPFVTDSCQQHNLQIPEEKAAVRKSSDALCHTGRSPYCPLPMAGRQAELTGKYSVRQPASSDAATAGCASEPKHFNPKSAEHLSCQSGLSTSIQLPAIAFNDTTTPILITILDLILHFDSSQNNAAIRHPLLIPGHSLGHAISLVLAATEQDEWEHINKPDQF